MTIERTIEILDALANGCSPITGEVIPNDSVLNEREVIRALERAIVLLENKTTESSLSTKVLIPEEEIKHAIEEGIEFINLASPIEYFADERGKVNKMRVQKMEL